MRNKHRTYISMDVHIYACMYLLDLINYTELYQFRETKSVTLRYPQNIYPCSSLEGPYNREELPAKAMSFCLV